jgi:hypothetical protein
MVSNAKKMFFDTKSDKSTNAPVIVVFDDSKLSVE